MKVDFIQASLILASSWAEYLFENYLTTLVVAFFLSYVITMTKILKKKGLKNE